MSINIVSNHLNILPLWQILQVLGKGSMSGWIHNHSLTFWKISNTLCWTTVPRSPSLTVCPQFLGLLLAMLKGFFVGTYYFLIFFNFMEMFLELHGDSPSFSPPWPNPFQEQIRRRRFSQIPHPVNRENQTPQQFPKLLITNPNCLSWAN